MVTHAIQTKQIKALFYSNTLLKCKDKLQSCNPILIQWLPVSLNIMRLKNMITSYWLHYNMMVNISYLKYKMTLFIIGNKAREDNLFLNTWLLERMSKNWILRSWLNANILCFSWKSEEFSKKILWIGSGRVLGWKSFRKVYSGVPNHICST